MSNFLDRLIADGRAKLEAEAVCRAAWAVGSDITIIRPRTILGHGRLGIFQILFEWVREGRNIPALGKGDNIYQFVHADDLADACILAGRRPGPAIYNCGASEFGTMRQVLEALCKYANTGSRVVSLPLTPTILAMHLADRVGISPLEPYHALMCGRSLYIDISKAQLELGWKPRYSNEEMMIQTYDWYLSNRASLGKTKQASPHRSPLQQGILSLLRRFY